MNKNKFRVWDKVNKKFVPPSYIAVNGDGVSLITDSGMLEKLQNRKYCVVDREYSIQQFIGILDSRMKEIYERDVVKFFTLNGEELGEVLYSTDSCAYYINDYPIMNISLESLEVVGNMLEDYMWDESGEKLVKII